MYAIEFFDSVVLMPFWVPNSLYGPHNLKPFPPSFSSRPRNLFISLSGETKTGHICQYVRRTWRERKEKQM